MDSDEDDTKVKPFTSAIGDVELATKLFGHSQVITWLKEDRWDYSRMTLSRDGKIDWKDEDKYDHDTTYFSGTYTLKGTMKKFTVIGRGKATAHYNANKGTDSSHFDKDVTREFASTDFTGEGFTITHK